MELTGMRDVKIRALTVCKEVLLAKDRPDNIKADVAMVRKTIHRSIYRLKSNSIYCCIG